MNRLHAFKKILMNEQTVLLLARTILSDGLVIFAQNYALSNFIETTILPGSFANAFLVRQASRLFSEHMNISVMIENDIFQAIDLD